VDIQPGQNLLEKLLEMLASLDLMGEIKMIEYPSKLNKHYGLKKPKDRVESILRLHGPLTMREICDRYNKTWRYGITTGQLTGMLSRNKKFVPKGDTKVVGLTGKAYNSTIWGVPA
tara:strand:- start:1955 stop:2302 length:348 start_codon:yes stop_codon:yes gene_type:complete